MIGQTISHWNRRNAMARAKQQTIRTLGRFLCIGSTFGSCLATTGRKSQQELSGTAVFLWWRADRVIVSADSRGTVDVDVNRPLQGSNVSHDDKDCKIVPMSTNSFYASSGVRRFNVQVGGVDLNWDTHEMAELALNAARSHGIAVEPKEVAAHWSEVATQRLNSVAPEFREEIRARSQVGTTKMLFVGLTDAGAIDVYVTYLQNNTFGFTSVPIQPPMNQIYALAEGGDILSEFTAKSSEQSKREIRKWDLAVKGKTQDEKDAAWMTQLIRWAIRYDRTGIIGGTPEEVELKPHGTVKWLKKCPQ